MAAYSSRSYLFLVLFCAAYLASRAAALSRNCSSDYTALPDPRLDPFVTANTTVAIYCVLAVDCSFGRALPHGPNGCFWVRYRARHLPVDLGSSIENTGTCAVCLVGDHLLLSTVDLPLQLSFYPQTAQAQFSEGKWEYAVLSNMSANLSVPIVIDWAEQPSPKAAGKVSYYRLISDPCNETLEFPPQNALPSNESTILYLVTTRRLLSDASGRSAAKQHVAIQAKVAWWSWKKKASVVGALAAASALLWLICTVARLLLCCMRRRRLRRRSTAAVELVEDDDRPVSKPDLWRKLGPRQFSHSELAAATCNFAEERKIGRGGFGPVYRGYLSDQDRHVAIKVLLRREQSVQGLKEFQAEVTVMSQLRHRYIVQLVGWCDSRRGLLLVYELMPGGSLDKHLYSPEKLLTWSERYKIALSLGSALLYLHTDCDRCVVHGDIKPANVMLDALCNAKLGDFGLARLVDHEAEPQTTQVIAGTVGYIDPCFVENRRPSTESDVYSFGVVLLEIASGRRPASTQSNGASVLQSWVRGMYDRGQILDAADRRLNGEFDERQMERVLLTGLWCAHQGQSERPSIAQAMDVLRSEEAKLPVVPAMSSEEQIRSLEERAYGDLPSEHSASAHASTATAYLTSKSSTYLLADE